MPSHPDAIADCVLSTFHALPAKFRPRKLLDGRREWVPLAGIVLSKGSYTRIIQPQNASSVADISAGREDDARSPPSSLTCAALATGMKCLPQNKLHMARGNVLHDWHAEILAIRAFNRFLVDECADLAANGVGSVGQWVRWKERGEQMSRDGCLPKQAARDKVDSVEEQRQPFTLQDDVTIHMYCSEAPCGDASMELTMAEQEDATPWSHNTTQPPVESRMLGRGHFDQLGIVRRKPARPDAPQTLSKSCSDKLALKQCTSLLSALTSTVLRPSNVYLSDLVLPETQCVPVAVERAFTARGRMAPIANAQDIRDRWQRAGYTFLPFDVKTTKREFEYSKRSAAPEADSPPSSPGSATAVPSNLSILVTPHRQEILINGVLQGRKQSDPRGASCASRSSLWKDVLDVSALAKCSALADGLRRNVYGEVKGIPELQSREQVKRDVRELALKGWKRNVGEEDWSLDNR